MSLSKVLTGVGLLALFAVESAFLPSNYLVHAEVGQSSGSMPPTNAPLQLNLEGSRTTRQTGYDFTAAEYFYPIKPGVDRSHWPERLTFEFQRDITLEDFKAKLEEQPWKPVFHCQGRALTVGQFSRSTLVDGVVNPSVTEEYSFANNVGQLKQTLHAPENNWQSWPEKQIHESSINLTQTAEGVFRARYYGTRRTSDFQVIKVRETGEILIYRKHKVLNYLICPNGTRPDTLYVPLSFPLISLSPHREWGPNAHDFVLRNLLCV